MGFQKIKKKLFPLALLVMMVILAATVAMAKSAAPIEDTGITGVVSRLLGEGEEAPGSYALLITKRIEGIPDEKTAEQEYSFTVQGTLEFKNGQFPVEEEIKLKAGQTWLIEVKAKGTLTVTETGKPGNIGEYKYLGHSTQGPDSKTYTLRFDTEKPTQIDISGKKGELSFTLDSSCPDKIYKIHVEGPQERDILLSSDEKWAVLTDLPSGEYSVTGETGDACGGSHSVKILKGSSNATIKDGDCPEIVITNWYQKEEPQTGFYRYVHEYYLRENGTETLEGKSEIGSSNEITLPDERTYTSADVTKVSTNNGNTYTYEQSKDAYGTVNPDGSYTPDGSKTSVIVTEDGSQIIILRYYREEIHEFVGTYKYVHEYYLRENGTETLEGKSEIGSSNEITLPDERTYTSADVTKVSTNNGNTYTYEQSKDAYGTVNPDGSYTPDGSKTSVIVTEDGSQIIILRYYRTKSDPPTTPNNNTISLTVEKKWAGDSEADHVNMEIKVQLLRNGEAVSGEIKTLNAKNGWKCEWTGLNNTFTYTVEEIDTPEGYISIQKQDGNTITITNTKTDTETTGLTVRKVWSDSNDAEGVRPERVTVQLLRNGEELGEAVTLNAENGWTHTWEKLEKQDKDGRDITYTVKEAGVQGYTSSQKQDGDTIIITNTREGTEPQPETTSWTVNKLWEDSGNAAGLRPGSVTIELLRNGVLADTVTLNEANGWTYTWEKLEKLDQNGAEFVYTVKEHYVPGYSHQYSGSGAALTITNTYQPELPPSLPDPNDPDTPDEVTVPDGDVPKTYKKVPEGDEYVWVEDEDPPLAPGEPEIPQTGDSARLGLWMLLSALSLCGLGAALFLKRRRGN